jgi:hypothetical protein
MSLARTALRLATMEALAPTVCLNGAEPWPTLAGKHVFDSRLDLLEAQIGFILFYHPTGKIWRDVTGRKVEDPRSVPHRSSEEGVRLARRTVTWKTELKIADCFDAAPFTAPTGLDRLPPPLRGVIEALAATAYGAKIGAGLALGAPVMPLAQPLGKIVPGLDIGHTGTPNVNLEIDL